MTDHLDAAAMQLGVKAFEPIATFAVPANGKMGRVTASVRGIRQTPEMRAIETDLCDFRLRVINEPEITGIAVTGPVGDKPGELQRLGSICEAGEQNAGNHQTASTHARSARRCEVH